MNEHRIRPALPADAPAIAGIHVRSWRAVYRGILPDNYLDGPADDERRTHWVALLGAATDADVILVLEDADRILGFVAGRMPCEDGYDACVDNLHVEPGLRGGGLGRRLFGAAAGVFQARGAANLFLWLFDGNDPAERFYARLGGVVTDHGFDDFAGARTAHTRIVFGDLPALAIAGRESPGTPEAHSG